MPINYLLISSCVYGVSPTRDLGNATNNKKWRLRVVCSLGKYCPGEGASRSEAAWAKDKVTGKLDP